MTQQEITVKTKGSEFTLTLSPGGKKVWELALDSDLTADDIKSLNLAGFVYESEIKGVGNYYDIYYFKKQ